LQEHPAHKEKYQPSSFRLNELALNP